MSENTTDTPAGNSSGNVALPYSNRPVSKAPGHWVLARAGKRVLRPGGLKLSLAMLDHAQLNGKDVVELAPGLGRTAAEIVKAQPKSYLGVDRDPDAVRNVEAVVGTLGTVIQADAQDTGLPAESADIIVGEAMLTMQGQRTKVDIMSEAARVLRPGGRYVIHELALTPDDIDPEVGSDISKALARAIHVNARPLTVAEWKRTLNEAGFDVEWEATAPMALLKASRNLEDEGLGGVLRILWNVLRDKELRKRVFDMRRTFVAHEQNMCGVALVARKR